MNLNLSSFVFILIVLTSCLTAIEGAEGGSTSATPRRRRGSKCKQTAGQADGCMQDLLIFGNRDFKPPTDDREVDAFCKKEYEAIDCVKSYGTTCLAPFPRQLFSIAALGAIQQQKKVCGSKRERKTFLYHMTCGHKVGIEYSHRCMEVAIIKMETISNSSAPEEQIPMACCVFHSLRECIVHQITHHCRGVTNETLTAKYFDSVLQGAMGDLLDLACGKYSSTTACARYLPAAMKRFETMQKEHLAAETPKMAPKSKSILMPFVDMFVKHGSL